MTVALGVFAAMVAPGLLAELVTRWRRRGGVASPPDAPAAPVATPPTRDQISEALAAITGPRNSTAVTRIHRDGAICWGSNCDDPARYTVGDELGYCPYHARHVLVRAIADAMQRTAVIK